MKTVFFLCMSGALAMMPMAAYPIDGSGTLEGSEGGIDIGDAGKDLDETGGGGSSSTAVTLSCEFDSCSDTVSATTISVSNCTTYTSTCYDTCSSTGLCPGATQVQSCTVCKSGYTRTAKTTTLGGKCNNSTVTYYDCVASSSCNGTCTDCTTTAWATVTTGYESRTEKTCNTSTCKCTSSVAYRCAAGYYGTPGTLPCSQDRTTGAMTCTGCTRCPSSGGIYGTSAAGSTAITSCYIPSGISMSDSVGTYTYTSNCYYTN